MRPLPTKSAVLAEARKHTSRGNLTTAEHYLRRAAKTSFYNAFEMDLKSISGDLLAYLHAFSPNVADNFERFELPA